MCVYITGMFEQAEQDIVNQIASLPDKDRPTKINLIKLRVIKENHTNVKERECFCSSVRRKIWYKDFIQWYEANS